MDNHWQGLDVGLYSEEYMETGIYRHSKKNECDIG